MHAIVAVLAVGQLALAAALVMTLRAVSHLRHAVEAQGTRIALMQR